MEMFDCGRINGRNYNIIYMHWLNRNYLSGQINKLLKIYKFDRIKSYEKNRVLLKTIELLESRIIGS